MSKQGSLNKVKDTLVKLKESIDSAEDRQIEAGQLKRNADERLEKAEEELESYRRRLKLLRADHTKTKKTLEEKESRFAHVEGRSLDDDEKRREFEGIEIERDDQLIAIEDGALVAKGQAAEASHALMETKRKLQVVETDMQKVSQRFDTADKKEKQHVDNIEKHSDELRSLEDRDNDAAEREMESEEKLMFLADQLKEAVVRMENAERDVVRNENIVTSIRNDVEAEKKKKDDITKEVERIDDLVEALNSGDIDALEALQPEPEPQEPEEPEQEEEDY